MLENEKLVTGRINQRMDAAIKERDHSTVNFLQWYVAEQYEEEQTIQQVLDKIHNIGEAGSGVYFIDRAIGAMVRQH